MYWIIIILVASALLLIAWASADVGSGIYLRCLCRKKGCDPIVALTFDDGPDEVMTPKVLDVLKEWNVRATFFIIGSKAEQWPQIVARMVAEGHTVGNHTYTHASAFPFFSAERMRTELRRTQQVVERITGKRMRLFRPPFGVTDPTIGRIVRSEGLQGIGWSIRSLDTLRNRSREAVCRKISRKLHAGAVILLHDRCEKADELLRCVLTEIKARGYELETIDNLFSIKRYED